MIEHLAQGCPCGIICGPCKHGSLLFSGWRRGELQLLSMKRCLLVLLGNFARGVGDAVCLNLVCLLDGAVVEVAIDGFGVRMLSATNNTNASNAGAALEHRSSNHADQPNAHTATMRRSTAAAAAAAARRRRPKELRELGRTPRIPLSQGSNTSYGGHRHSVSVVQW